MNLLQLNKKQAKILPVILASVAVKIDLQPTDWNKFSCNFTDSF